MEQSSHSKRSSGPSSHKVHPVTLAAGVENILHQPLNMRLFDNIGTLSGDETLLWKIKTAVSGMNRDLAEMLVAVETDGIKNFEEVSKEDTFMDANKGACVKASSELYSAPTRHTSSEASTIVENVTGFAER